MKNNNKKVLIIEDDPFIADVYVLKLESEGYSVETAEDGAKGMEKLKNKKYDVVLLDIIMPNMDGFKVLERIKMAPELNKIPVVILTNLSQKKDIQKGIDLGAADYIVKTKFTPTEVIKTINKVLEGK
ncbi:MAG: response regulator [Candidatus Moranbacteria bacterium]|nr:response regulator [Candidatus Moranbacteria bacterium]